MLGKLFVSRLSACRFLLSFSSCQLVTFGPHRPEIYSSKSLKSLPPPNVVLALGMSAVTSETREPINGTPLGKVSADML